jgi:hypothetical protein
MYFVGAFNALSLHVQDVRVMDSISSLFCGDGKVSSKSGTRKWSNNLYRYFIAICCK